MEVVSRGIWSGRWSNFGRCNDDGKFDIES